MQVEPSVEKLFDPHDYNIIVDSISKTSACLCTNVVHHLLAQFLSVEQSITLGIVEAHGGK